MAKKNIAIIGAGLSGLSVASFLKDHAAITIFEKAWGFGGRMSTRYTDDFQFDASSSEFTPIFELSARNSKRSIKPS